MKNIRTTLKCFSNNMRSNWRRKALKFSQLLFYLNRQSAENSSSNFFYISLSYAPKVFISSSFPLFRSFEMKIYARESWGMLEKWKRRRLNFCDEKNSENCWLYMPKERERERKRENSLTREENGKTFLSLRILFSLI